MKSLHKILLTLFTFLAAALLLASCKKDNAPNNGEPRVRYVRITDPASADSLLIGAGQGQLIAIVGENLQHTTEVWFNDQQAFLTPTYISDKSIIVRIPSPIPEQVTNQVKLVFSDGKSLLYDFTVDISKPVVSSMFCEHVNEGGVATIRGNYFYSPVSVTFTGGVTGELVFADDDSLQVIVPAGALPGPITVKTNFGETKSDFWFRDNRNMFIDSDPYEGWWNESYVVSNPAAGDPPKISGNYIRYRKFTGAWSWNELAGGPAANMPQHSKNIPDAAILKPDEYNLKFEINTVKPYSASAIRINVALNAQDNDAYQWAPPFDTRGQWQTVTIPFEEVVASYKVKPTINPDGYWCRLLVQGPGDLDADICFDNFRVVPKVLK